MALKIIHTADLHIGAKLLFLGEKAGQQREQIKKTFEVIVDKAISLNADLFLLAGDAFDNAYPSEINVAFFIEQITRLIDKGIFVAQIPGNHDYLRNESVYLHNEFFIRKHRNYRFFTEEYATWDISDLNVMLQASAVTKQKSRVSPLSGFRKGEKDRIEIGLAHGSLAGINADANFPINKEDIAALGLDYLALGDWHGTLDVSSKGAASFYPGAPEAVASDQTGSGNMLFIEIEKGSSTIKNKASGTYVKPLAVGSKKMLKLDIDVGKFAGPAELMKEIKQYRGKDTILLVQFTGLLNLDFNLDPDELQRSLQQEFFYLKLDDNSQLQISREELQKYPRELITGRFIEVLQAQKKAKPEEGALIDKALQLGIKLLTSTDA